MDIVAGILLGFLTWFFVRIVLFGVYTVDQNERAVKTNFGRAERVQGGKTTLDDPIAESLRPEERDRYNYPQVRVIPPGGPYFKMPWQKIHKVSIATMTVNMALDLEEPTANDDGTRLEAVTKDQLNTGLTGQIRYRVSESNLYAFLFGIKKPFVHVMAYFVSVLRQRIANFEAKPDAQASGGSTTAGPECEVPGGEMIGVSINDLRKNLRDLNEYMDNECRSTHGAIRRDVRRVADYGDRSAAGGGVGAGGDQYRAQPGFERYQPGAGVGGSEDCAVQARRGDRDAESAGGDGAAEVAGGGIGGVAAGRTGGARGVSAEMCGWRCSKKPNRSIWR